MMIVMLNVIMKWMFTVSWLCVTVVDNSAPLFLTALIFVLFAIEICTHCITVVILLLFKIKLTVYSSLPLKAFDGLGDMLMPAMAPQAAGAPSPVKPMGGNLDSAMANMASSTFPSTFHLCTPKSYSLNVSLLAPMVPWRTSKRFFTVEKVL